jgi:hypothetical protein
MRLIVKRAAASPADVAVLGRAYESFSILLEK